MGNKKTLRVIISVPEGHIVRNLFENRLLDKIFQKWPGSEIVIFSPAYKIKEFTDKWSYGDRVRFEQLIPYNLGKRGRFWLKLRKKLIKFGLPSISRYCLKMERRELNPFYNNMRDIFKERTTETVLLCTHIHLAYERPLANLAHHYGIPVLGIVNSWDNVYKGIMTHVDKALVWNNVNKREMHLMEAYPEDKVDIFGVHAFEPYFDNSNLLSREEFARVIGFDPKRPILVYASIGQFVPFFEETFILDKLNEYSAGYDISARPQIICRLHPWSKRALFDRFKGQKDLIFSEFKTYIPTLNWAPTFEEVVFSANMLHHADICISPGSTMVLESAYFNTPVVVPVYNEFQPYIWNDYYSRYCLAWHFGRLVRKNWIELVRNDQEFFGQLDDYLADPTRHTAERAKIVEEYIGAERQPIDCIIENLAKIIRRFE